MTPPLTDVCCARFPASFVAALAELRCRADIDVIRDGDSLWLRWNGDDEILRHVLPLPGVELFVRRGDAWVRFGERLPCDGPPDNADVLRLDRVIAPAPLSPTPAPVNLLEPTRLLLVRDAHARPASALRCSLGVLATWADSATTMQIESLQAARCGERVLLLGKRLPPLADAERFWGSRVLVPLGWRPEPALPESALVEALGLLGEDIALLGESGTEVLSRNDLQPLTRAGVRLAAAERVT
jgi:hypothetical protein